MCRHAGRQESFLDTVMLMSGILALDTVMLMSGILALDTVMLMSGMYANKMLYND